MSWLRDNLTSSFSEFTSQLSTLTGDVIPAGIAQDGEERDNDELSPSTENGVNEEEAKTEDVKADLALPVCDPADAPTDTSTGYQEATFSPIKEHDNRFSGQSGVLASTPNSSTANLSDFLGETGSFIGDAGSFVGAGGDYGDGSLPPLSGAEKQHHGAVDGENGVLPSTHASNDTDEVEKLKAKIEAGKKQIASLCAEHERELLSVRDSHKLKLQALHEHQQADLEEMEQRISELETHRQQSELELSQHHLQSSELDSVKEQISSMQASIDSKTVELQAAQQLVDEHKLENSSLRSSIEQKEQLVSALQVDVSTANASAEQLREKVGAATERIQSLEEAHQLEEKVMADASASRRDSESRQAAAFAALSDEHTKLQTSLEECQKQLSKERHRVEELSMSASETARLSELLAQEQTKHVDLSRSANELQSLVTSREQELEEVRSTLQQYQTESEQHGQQLQQAHAAMSETSEKYSKLQTEHAELCTAHSSLQSQLSAEKASTESMRSASVDATLFEQLKLSLSECQQQLRTSQASCASLSQRSEELQSLVASRDEEVSNLQRGLQHQQAENAKHMLELEQARSSRDAASEQYSKLQAAHENVCTARSQLQQELSAERSSMQSVRSSTVDTAQFEQVEARLEQCQQQLQSTQAELTALTIAKAEVEDRVRTISSQDSDLQQDQSILRQQLADSEARNAELSQLATSKSSELSSIQLHLLEQQQREESLVTQLDNALLVTKETEHKYGQVVSDYESQLSVCREQQAHTDRELKEVKESYATELTGTVQQSQLDLEQQRNTWMTDLTAEKERCSELQSTADHLQSQVAKLTDERNSATRELDHMQADSKERAEELDRLRASEQLATEEHVKLLATHQQLSATCTQLEGNLSTERRTVEAMRGSSSSETLLFEETKMKASQYEAQLARALEEISSLQAARTFLEQQHSEKLAEVHLGMQATQQDFNGKLSEEKAKCSGLEEAAKNARSQLDTKAAELKALQSGIEEHRSKEVERDRELDEARSSARHSAEEHARLLHEHSLLSQAHSSLEEELSRERSTTQSVRSSSVDLQLFEEVQTNIQHYQQQLARAEEQLAHVKELRDAQVETHAKALAEERALLQRDREELSTELTRERGQVEALTLDRENLQAKLDESSSACSQLESNRNALTLERDSLQAKLIEASSLYSNLDSRSSALTLEKDGLQAKLDEVTGLYSQLNSSSRASVNDQDKKQKESDRLRQHLLMVEEQHTQDLLDAEKLQQELREELNSAQHNAESRGVAAEEDLARCHLEIQQLQERIGGVSEERNLAMQQLVEVEQKAESSTSALNRLQLVLEQFQKDQDDQVRMALKPLQAKLKACEAQIEQHVAEMDQCQEEIAEKESLQKRLQTLAADVEGKLSEIQRLKANVADCQTALDVSQGQVRRLAAAAEGKVDINLVRNLLLTYLTAPAEKQHDVLRPVASILGFSGTDMKKVSGQHGSWLGSWLNSDARQVRPIPSDKSFTELFVEFLEAESTPGSVVAAAQGISPSAVKDGHIKTSQLPASAFANRSLPLSSGPGDQLALSRLALSGSPSTPTASLPLGKTTPDSTAASSTSVLPASSSSAATPSVSASLPGPTALAPAPTPAAVSELSPVVAVGSAAPVELGISVAVGNNGDAATTPTPTSQPHTLRTILAPGAE